MTHTLHAHTDFSGHNACGSWGLTVWQGEQEVWSASGWLPEAVSPSEGELLAHLEGRRALQRAALGDDINWTTDCQYVASRLSIQWLPREHPVARRAHHHATRAPSGLPHFMSATAARSPERLWLLHELHVCTAQIGSPAHKHHANHVAYWKNKIKALTAQTPQQAAQLAREELRKSDPEGQWVAKMQAKPTLAPQYALWGYEEDRRWAAAVLESVRQVPLHQIKELQRWSWRNEKPLPEWEDLENLIEDLSDLPTWVLLKAVSNKLRSEQDLVGLALGHH